MKNIEAYIVSNQNIAEDVPLVNFKVDLKEFEKKSGIEGVESITDYFFPSIWQVVP